MQHRYTQLAARVGFTAGSRTAAFLVFSSCAGCGATMNMEANSEEVRGYNCLFIWLVSFLACSVSSLSLRETNVHC